MRASGGAVMAQRKYARVGELVKIVVPREFIRCGYPLSIKDVMLQDFAEIEAACERMFTVLENRSVPGPPEPKSSEVGTWEVVPVVGRATTMSATVHGMLCSAIAAYRLEERGFGGDIRQIFETDDLVPFLCGELWVVASKKYVKTGKRYPSSSYYSPYSGEYDYKPGGLEDEKTHCIYTIKRNGIAAKILAANCERLASVPA
jgi:hypothetical protein